MSLKIFQRLWSGHVTNEDKAFELLSLIDSINLWAITEHQTFILDHLKAWHESCNKNLFLEWDSKFDYNDNKKRRRKCNEDKELNLPKWVSYFKEPSQRNIQARAQQSLNQALIDDCQIRREFESTKAVLDCRVDGCEHKMVPRPPIFVHHYRTVHLLDERELAKMRSEFQKDFANYGAKQRLKDGVTLSGKKSGLLRAALKWKDLAEAGPNAIGQGINPSEVEIDN
jgi:hypothetical protein